MNIVVAWWNNLMARRKARKFQQAVKLVESQGLTVCEIATKAGADYIRASDGSWRKIGRGDIASIANKKQKPANKQIALAIKRGEDTTGLSTVRDAVSLMEEFQHNPMEMFFDLKGTRYNVMIEIIGRNGVRVGGKE